MIRHLRRLALSLQAMIKRGRLDVPIVGVAKMSMHRRRGQRPSFFSGNGLSVSKVLANGTWFAVCRSLRRTKDEV